LWPERHRALSINLKSSKGKCSETNKQFNNVNYIKSSGSILDIEQDLGELCESRYFPESLRVKEVMKDLIMKLIHEVRVITDFGKLKIS
jgi:hypothetical protein